MESPNTQTQENTGGLGGNTSSPKPIRSRKWCLTINNYTNEIFDYVKTHGTQKTQDFIIGKEIGDNGTPHLQIFFNYANAKSFDVLKKEFPMAHIEKANGTIQQNIDYCSKENNYISNKYIEKPEIIDYEILYDWQKDIINTIQNIKPNNRTVYWYCDVRGNSGKSVLGKYLYYHKLAEVIKSAKSSDIKNILFMNKNARDIIIDVSRSQGNYISYTLIEELKDGMIYSGKYEGGQKLISTPHIFIFSNELPDVSKLSKDRWIIKEINNGEVTDITEETLKIMEM